MKQLKIKWWYIGLAFALLLAAFAPLASSSPDGLERVAGDKGFIGLAKVSPIRLMADYVFPGIENETLATILAGLAGTFVLFLIMYGLAWLVKFRKRTAG